LQRADQQQAAKAEAAAASWAKKKAELKGKIQQAREWDEEEVRMLDKALVKFPVGVPRRWEQITAYVRTRTQQEVIFMCKVRRFPASHVLISVLCSLACSALWIILSRHGSGMRQGADAGQSAGQGPCWGASVMGADHSACADTDAAKGHLRVQGALCLLHLVVSPLKYPVLCAELNLAFSMVGHGAWLECWIKCQYL
jgi:hypothetical protein